MFLGDSAERDLGQAVKFLCANGECQGLLLSEGTDTVINEGSN